VKIILSAFLRSQQSEIAKIALFSLIHQHNQKNFKKPLASCFAFDSFPAPSRPKGSADSMIANR
jgi:hypothetical protein